MLVNSHAVRRFRKELLVKARFGKLPLFVVGSMKDGFRLGVRCSRHRPDNDPVEVLVLVGPLKPFGKQKDAVAYGEKKSGRTARKLASVPLAVAA